MNTTSITLTLASGRQFGHPFGLRPIINAHARTVISHFASLLFGSHVVESLFAFVIAFRVDFRLVGAKNFEDIPDRSQRIETA